MRDARTISCVVCVGNFWGGILFLSFAGSQFVYIMASKPWAGSHTRTWLPVVACRWAGGPSVTRWSGELDSEIAWRSMPFEGALVNTFLAPPLLRLRPSCRRIINSDPLILRGQGKGEGGKAEGRRAGGDAAKGLGAPYTSTLAQCFPFLQRSFGRVRRSMSPTSMAPGSFLASGATSQAVPPP